MHGMNSQCLSYPAPVPFIGIEARDEISCQIRLRTSPGRLRVPNTWFYGAFAMSTHHPQKTEPNGGAAEIDAIRKRPKRDSPLIFGILAITVFLTLFLLEFSRILSVTGRVDHALPLEVIHPK